MLMWDLLERHEMCDKAEFTLWNEEGYISSKLKPHLKEYTLKLYRNKDFLHKK